MESDGDHFLAYYLPKEDETADTFKQKRTDGEEVEVRQRFFASHYHESDMRWKETVFSFVRDYETVKIEQEVPNEFMLVLDDDGDGSEDSKRSTRGKGAFYKGLERKIVLKKKRVSVSIWITFNWLLFLRRFISIAMGRGTVHRQVGRYQPHVGAVRT